MASNQAATNHAKTRRDARLALLVIGAIAGGTVGCTRGEDTLASIGAHGPHGGHMAQVSAGAGFEIELTADEKRRRIVLYVLDATTAEPYPLRIDALDGAFEIAGQSVEVTFVPDPRPDDPEDHASRFAIELDKLPQQLLLSNEFELKLSYTAGGKAIAATIPHRNDHAHEYHHD
ncbi:MAG: hypothetical protein AAFV43_00615 [Planctomycetota bacterium]